MKIKKSVFTFVFVVLSINCIAQKEEKNFNQLNKNNITISAVLIDNKNNLNTNGFIQSKNNQEIITDNIDISSKKITQNKRKNKSLIKVTNYITIDSKQVSRD